MKKEEVLVSSFITPTSHFPQASAPDDDIEAEKKKSTVVKIVMTGSADDGANWQPHIRSKLRRKALATRFKDTKDPFCIVIIRDMWLTGLDAQEKAEI